MKNFASLALNSLLFFSRSFTYQTSRNSLSVGRFAIRGATLPGLEAAPRIRNSDSLHNLCIKAGRNERPFPPRSGGARLPSRPRIQERALFRRPQRRRPTPRHRRPPPPRPRRNGANGGGVLLVRSQNVAAPDKLTFIHRFHGASLLQDDGMNTPYETAGGRRRASYSPEAALRRTRPTNDRKIFRRFSIHGYAPNRYREGTRLRRVHPDRPRDRPARRGGRAYNSEFCRLPPQRRDVWRFLRQCRDALLRLRPCSYILIRVH